MSPSSIHDPKCLGCGILFRASKRHPEQQFCSDAECRKASKRHSQRQWLERHPDYFCGSEHIERVRAWRKDHPGYSRGKRRKPKAPKEMGALQDLVPSEVPRGQPVAAKPQAGSSDFSQKEEASDSCNEPALQDLVLLQSPLMVGLISAFSGEALQETFAPFAQWLVERGRRVLGHAGPGGGRTGAVQTTDST